MFKKKNKKQTKKLHPEPWSAVSPCSDSQIKGKICLYLTGNFQSYNYEYCCKPLVTKGNG